MNDSATTFWKARAENYEDLQWVKDDQFMEQFLEAARPHPEDVVLDVGTGVGKVAKAVGPFVEKVIGIDISPDMIGKAGNGEFLRQDVRELEFEDETFDKVLARMVLHHVTDGIEQAMAECYRTLKPGGVMVVGEGTPPMAETGEYHLQDEITDWYREVFELKEDRLTLYEYDIVNLMAEAGFRGIWIDLYYIKKLSVRNWLENSGLLKATQERIYKKYLLPPNSVERAYHMTTLEDDVLIKCRHAIVVGTKPEQPCRSYEIQHMMRHISDLLTPPGKALYIGASRRTEGMAELKEAGHEITVLEIWPANVWLTTADSRVDHVIEGDMRDIGTMGLPHYDIAFWWHGPEHLRRDDVPPALKELEKLADLVIVGCPNGPFPLGPQYGNPHETHVSEWYAKDFEQLGYNTEWLAGRISVPEEHLLAWRRCDEAGA